MFSVVSLIWEGASLALVDQPYIDDATVKIPYGVDVLLHWPTSHPMFCFPIGLVKTEYDFIVSSIETGQGRWIPVIAVVSVNVNC